MTAPCQCDACALRRAEDACDIVSPVPAGFGRAASGEVFAFHPVLHGVIGGSIDQAASVSHEGCTAA